MLTNILTSSVIIKIATEVPAEPMSEGGLIMVWFILTIAVTVILGKALRIG